MRHQTLLVRAPCRGREKRYHRDDNKFLVLVLPYLNNVEYFEEYYDEIEVCQVSAKAHFKGAT